TLLKLLEKYYFNRDKWKRKEINYNLGTSEVIMSKLENKTLEDIEDYCEKCCKDIYEYIQEYKKSIIEHFDTIKKEILNFIFNEKVVSFFMKEMVGTIYSFICELISCVDLVLKDIQKDKFYFHIDDYYEFITHVLQKFNNEAKILDSFYDRYRIYAFLASIIKNGKKYDKFIDF